MEFLLKCTDLVNFCVFISLAEAERATVSPDTLQRGERTLYLCMDLCTYCRDLHTQPKSPFSQFSSYCYHLHAQPILWLPFLTRTCTFKLPCLYLVTVFTFGISPSSKVYRVFVTFHIAVPNKNPWNK